LSCPGWKKGDRFLYRRGGQVRSAWRVLEATEAGYELGEESSGLVLLLDKDLGQLAEEDPNAPEQQRVLAPRDAQLSWPLWHGKHWVVEYLRKVPNEPALPIVAAYECDGVETIKVPAGSFECWRIWRRARPAIEGRRFLDQSSILWYAPQVGWFVRRLEDGVLTELESWQRQ
jgi:hypothetical protein